MKPNQPACESEESRRSPSLDEVDRVLDAIRVEGNNSADLLPVVYGELRKLAATKLAQERPGQTLQATALVHEAYLRLAESSNASNWDTNGHFFAAAAEAMRRILVDKARHKKTEKAGGTHLARIGLSDVACKTLAAVPDASVVDIIALSDALQRLAVEHERKAELIKLRFFAGLTNKQAAAALGISSSTADNDWAYAKAWLLVELAGDS